MMNPKYAEKAQPFYQASMKREEDFQRTQGIVNIPLISLSSERSSFKKESFPSNLICLERTNPYDISYNSIMPDVKKDFSWDYLDDCSSPIVDLETFKENFAIFSMNQLDALNWNNIFAAGGTKFIFLVP